MDAAAAGRKRGRPEVNGAGDAGAKRAKETKSVQSGLGSKSKPCTKFFSTIGCPFGEGCHFLHYVPGGLSAAAQIMNLSNTVPPSRNSLVPPTIPDATVAASSGVFKTRMCNKFATPEGCRFGDKCHFAHGERELGKPVLPSHDDRAVAPPLTGRFSSRPDLPPAAAPAGFGASATAKISVHASLAGGIIGKGGVNTKEISRITGAKLYIKDHDSDTSLRYIELEGTFDQIKHASNMVKVLIENLSVNMPPAAKKPAGAAPGGLGSNYKTKLCDNFAKGTCTFGDGCHFAHGPNELRKGTT